MYIIEHASLSIDQLVESIKTSIAERQLGKLMTFQLADGWLTVTFKRAGTSTIQFEVLPHAQGFARLRVFKFEVAPLHAEFRTEIEHKIEKLLKSLGATIIG